MANVQADIEYTKDLFEAANRMRGSIAPAEYKHIVLPLIFLRYLSLRYEKRRKELESMVRDPKSDWYTQDSAMQEIIMSDEDQYRSEQVYVIPDEASWSYIVEHARQPNIKEILDNAMKRIEEENKDLEGVLPRIYQASNLPAENLGELIHIFSRDVFNLEYSSSVDVLGRVYEYFIGNFASSEGNRGGEFFTPSSIVKLLVAMLEPMSGVVFDPACGSGGMFIQSEQYTPQKQALSFYGQENIETTIRLGKMNVLLHGINAEIRMGDSLLNDQFEGFQADYVLSNPPFNQKLWGADKIQRNDPRLIGPVTDSNANYMWMQHFLSHLKDGGTAGFVMANGAMTTNTTGEKEVRQRLVEDGYVDCIVQMPDRLFFTTGIPCALIFFSKNRNGEKGFRPRKNEFLFIDARQKGTMVSRKQKVLTQEEIDEIARVYHAYRSSGDKYEDVLGFCKVAIFEDVKANDFKLTPGIYVGTELKEADDEPFEVKMAELTQRLKEQYAQANKLQEQLLRNLENLR
ncbi:type I restriction-modification system subunit M [Alicyclobacillus ferrooxydans]|uniref:site-specific DNA-methyltransferase (adenine-specific) n=1 Tax=Alicyclobacillus ferrooxydans TaxID=471514 RepID=A0A0P9CVR5_9BACL|nr:class I SAM-dependent DNA methyltransferase [Alicyclobacillus ferrooxydans]KPV43827.1 DNA methyltransferase [Alicyclobacillus ferrooxydans]